MDIKFTEKELESMREVNECMKELNNAIRICKHKGIRFTFIIEDYESDVFDKLRIDEMYVHRSVSRYELEEAIKAQQNAASE